ncbi:MAG: translation elongation factor Ts [Bacteroidales bacterium]
MANITAADINKLRQITGAGMMDCKAALIENDGDIQAAIDWLRKKGQKVAEKRADREANEGYVVAKTNGDHTFGVVLMLNCETDFVAKNDDFKNFAIQVADLAIENKPSTLEELKGLELNGRTVADHVSEQVGKIGEKIDFNAYQQISAPAVFAYNHHGNRLATILGFSSNAAAGLDTLGKEICMQIAAMSPIAIDKDNVDATVINREIEIGMEQARQEGKPEAMLENIAKGKLNKFFKERTLLNQEFIKDGKKTVGQIIAEADASLKVTTFYRIALGE